MASHVNDSWLASDPMEEVAVPLPTLRVTRKRSHSAFSCEAPAEAKCQNQDQAQTRRAKDLQKEARRLSTRATRTLTKLNTQLNRQMQHDSFVRRELTSPSTFRAHDGRGDYVNNNSNTASTPRHQKKKRVRFSDPGPESQSMINEADDMNNSTGLTPSLSRASFEEGCEQMPFRKVRLLATSSHRVLRRASAPTPLIPAATIVTATIPSDTVLDPVFPLENERDENCSPMKFQFTPISDILDERAKRRIRRVGLSEEMTRIDRRKRTEKNKDTELAALKQELEEARKSQEALNEQKIVELESEIQKLRETISTPKLETPYHPMSHQMVDMMSVDESSFNDQTVLISSSPDLRACRPAGDQSRITTLSLDSDATTISMTTETGIQVCISNHAQEAELRSLSLELEAAKKEKRDLFHEWKIHLGSSNANGATMADTNSPPSPLRLSPPPSFMFQIVPTLQDAMKRAGDAITGLDMIKQELSNMGFSGKDAYESVTQLRQDFRAARLELERALPGETANASLGNGMTTLSALVNKVKTLVKTLRQEVDRHSGACKREKALRTQFDTCLLRCESSSLRIKDLEETIELSAEDMLHTRIRVQELEQEVKEKGIAVDRLNAALDKYHDEVRNLESVITTLEAENEAAKQSYQKRISDLENRAVTENQDRLTVETKVTEQERRISELQETLQLNKATISKLTVKAESLETERLELSDTITSQITIHDNETGLLNTRLAELTTALEFANSEIGKLRQRNIGLETRLSAENEALLRVARHVSTALTAECRSAKVRDANWKIQSDEIDTETEPMLPGSEPITPVSMASLSSSASSARFSNVQITRGKRRRRVRPDSGIGILTEEESDFDSYDNDNHSKNQDQVDEDHAINQMAVSSDF